MLNFQKHDIKGFDSISIFEGSLPYIGVAAILVM